jgi:hypothetical protein
VALAAVVQDALQQVEVLPHLDRDTPVADQLALAPITTAAVAVALVRLELAGLTVQPQAVPVLLLQLLVLL